MRRTRPILIIHPSLNIGGVIEWRTVSHGVRKSRRKRHVDFYRFVLELRLRFLYEVKSLYTIRRCDYPIRLVFPRYILVRSYDKSCPPPPPPPPSLNLTGLVFSWTAPWLVALRAESVRRHRKRDSKKFLYLFLDLTQRMLRVLLSKPWVGKDRGKIRELWTGRYRHSMINEKMWRGKGRRIRWSRKSFGRKDPRSLDRLSDIRCRFYLYARVKISKIIPRLSPALKLNYDITLISPRAEMRFSHVVVPKETVSAPFVGMYGCECIVLAARRISQ